MKKIIAATFAVLMCTASALADLAGTNLTVTITHDQYAGLSALNNAVHTYGGPSVHDVIGWGSITLSSPAIAPAMDNALNVDFTNFAYSAFTAPFPAIGTITLHNLAEAFDPMSVKILVNGMDIATNVAANGNGFQASWSAVTVFGGNPVQPNMTVAWNSVPAPGAFALIGLAGLVAVRRKRAA